MAKRYILITALIIFSIIGLYSIKAVQEKNEVSKYKKQYLSKLKINSLQYSTTLEPLNKKGFVLVYFNSECGSCRYQVLSIWRNLDQFKAIQIFLISSEPTTVLLDFFKTIGVTEKINFNFGKINPEDVFETFGSVSTPNIFIYSKDRKLIKEFKGETKIEAILKYLP